MDSVSTLQRVATEPKVKLQEQKSKKAIGILGGTFNPIHIAHLLLAEQVYSKLNLDEIWFIPDNIPPHLVKKGAIDARDRVEMLRLAISDNPHFKLELMEIIRGGVSYTMDTIKALKKRYPENDFYLIMGGDMVNDFKNWKNPDELASLIKLVGVKRPGYVQLSNYPVIWVDAPFMSVSSTQIRELLLAGESVRYLVPDKVIDYINEKGLYRG